MSSFGASFRRSARTALAACRYVALRERIAILAIGVMGVTASAATTGLLGVPAPRYHDEFSYLLQADTFAHGRVTNPTHPMWMHFESMHIIQQPTYASKYPPAQSLVLALGQRIGGHPIVGVWLSIGLMCAAICWMLYGWLPPSLALLGAGLAVLRFGTAGYWAQSYWGGAVAATGGALVFGAVRRIGGRDPWRVWDAVWLGVGLAILANSRPYEGLLASLPAGLVLVRALLTGRQAGRRLRLILLPLLAVLVATGLAMSYYNWRVTGDPLRLPYQVHEATYRVEPIFLWLTPKPAPVYHNAVLQQFHAVWEMALYAKQKPVGGYGFRVIKLDQFTQLWTFFCGYALTPPLVLLPWALRDKWIRFALIPIGLVALGLLGETWVLVHYAAPVTGLLLLLPIAGVAAWRARDHAVGGFVAILISTISVLSAVLTVVSEMRTDYSATWYEQRHAIETRLDHTPGSHLIIVQYGPHHSVQNEWVYNRADIDSARVVWARAIDADADSKLLAYFKGRQVWRLTVDDGTPPAVLEPYGP